MISNSFNKLSTGSRETVVPKGDIRATEKAVAERFALPRADEVS